MNPLKLDLNETTRFFLPLMFSNITHDELFGQYFQEAYIGMLDNNKYDDTLILKFDSGTDFECVNNTPIEIITTEEHTLFVFDIPESVKEDYGEFLIGNYKGLSEEAKNTITKFWNEEEPSMLHGVFGLTEISIKLLTPVLKSKEISTWPPPDVIGNELYKDF